MKTHIFVVLFFFSLFTGLHGAPFYETSLQEIGYEGLSISLPNQSTCQTIAFSFPENWQKTDTITPIFSFNITAGPVREGSAHISIVLNDINITTIYPEDLLCNETTCWKRIPVSRSSALLETNTLAICAHTSSAITRLEVSNKSMIGLYTTPLLSIKTVPATNTVFEGEHLSIQLRLTNTGSERATNITFQRAREVAVDKNVFRVVSGATQWAGDLSPGETITITYTISPKITGTFSLPPAILYFENIFGERDFQFADPVQIVVNPLTIPVDARIIKQTSQVKTGDTIPIQLVLKNKAGQPLQNMRVSLNTSLKHTFDDTQAFALAPHETRAIPIIITAGESGNHSIFCTILSPDFPESSITCSPQSLTIVDAGVSPTIIAGIAFLAVGAIVFLIIHFSRN